MYQPVSYKLGGRMGTRDELRAAVHGCRALGVRTYADAVLNHMVGGGNDANPDHRNDAGVCTYWGAKNSSLTGGTSASYTQRRACAWDGTWWRDTCKDVVFLLLG